MTGPARPNQPDEARLDELLDQLIAGEDVASPDDPELQGLTTIAQAIHDDDQIEWPDESFPDQLTASLYSEVRPANGRVTSFDATSAEPWDDEPVPHRQQTATIPESDMAELTGRPSRLAELRKLARIAAAVAGFGLLTLVLIAVFQGFGDDQPAAIGTGDSDRPPQLAVTMRTDPVNGNPDIFLVSLDGSDPVNLTDNPANDTMPAWSPDGSKIAFISDRSGSDRLYVMEADGSYVREISPSYMYDQNPDAGWHLRNLTWSPDGSTIALMRYPPGPDTSDARVLIVAANGIGLRLGDTHPDYPELPLDQTPIWSPDSSFLLFEVRNEEETRLAVKGRGTGYRTLLLPDHASGSAASWSANGSLAVAHEDGINIVEFTGDPPSNLVSDEVARLPISISGKVTGVEWSPDESQLALTLDSLSGSSVWIAGRDGSDLAEVPGSMTGVHPAWSPDGSQVAFLRAGVFSGSSAGYDLMLYDTESASITLLADTGFSGQLTSPPVWRPNRIEPESDPAATATPTMPADEQAPTPSGVPNPEDVLSPPEARLHTERGMTEGYYGTYSWRFSDPDQTYTQIDAPIVIFTDNPTTVVIGEELVVSLRGEELTRPPERTTIEIYDFADNQTFPEDPSGQTASEPSFTIQTEPVMSIEAEDPAAPELTLDVPPDRYALFVRSDWGPHPVLDREIYVTWVFDVEVVESTPPPNSSTDQDEPAASPTPVDVPLPPLADLRVGSRVIEGTLGSYTWQFDDADSSLRSAVYSHVPRIFESPPFASTAMVEVVVHGYDDIDSPLSTTIEVFAIDLVPEGSSEPIDQPPGAGRYEITMQDEPLTTITADNPAAPEFSLDVPPGHYAVFVRSSWGQHPTLDREIYVTWVFHVEVTDGPEASADFQDDPRVQQAIEQVRTFLADPEADLIADSIYESEGDTFVRLTQRVPGIDGDDPLNDEFVVDVSHGTTFAASIVSNTLHAQRRNPVDENEARAIAEAFLEQHHDDASELSETITPQTVGIEEPYQQLLGFQWGRQVDGVWMPTIVRVSVNLDTGLVMGYFAFDYTYEGPMEPQITEEEARRIAEDVIASDPDLSGASVDSVRLATTFGNVADSIVEDLESDWRLAWEFTLTDRHIPNVDHIVWIDALTGSRLKSAEGDEVTIMAQ